jgi:hypothetical protein
MKGSIITKNVSVYNKLTVDEQVKANLIISVNVKGDRIRIIKNRFGKDELLAKISKACQGNIDKLAVIIFQEVEG